MPSRNFLVALALGLALVAGLLFFGVFSVRNQHVNLDGKILKVRTIATDEKNAIVVVDFRATNSSNIPFVAREALVYVTGPDGKEVEGMPIARTDMDRIFGYYKLLGPKYNQVFIMRDRVPPGQSMDRMVAAAFPLSEVDVQNRKSLTLRLHDVDGPTYDFTSH